MSSSRNSLLWGIASVVLLVVLVVFNPIEHMIGFAQDIGILKRPTPIQESPISQRGAIGYVNNLTIRIDSAKLLRDDGDYGTGGEVVFALLVRRVQGDTVSTAKLVSPGQGVHELRVGDTVGLGDFSLQINNVTDSDRIGVYFLAFDDDGEQQAQGSVAIAAGADVVLEAISDAIPSEQSIFQMAISRLGGPILAYWQQQDPLGEIQLTLDRSNNWLQGQQYIVHDPSNNLEVAYTILQSTELIVPTEDIVELNVENNSSSTISRLYIWPTNEGIWRSRIDTNLSPGASQTFRLEAGQYDLRAEGEQGLYWEKAAVEVQRYQVWNIVN